MKNQHQSTASMETGKLVHEDGGRLPVDQQIDRLRARQARTIAERIWIVTQTPMTQTQFEAMVAVIAQELER